MKKLYFLWVWLFVTTLTTVAYGQMKITGTAVDETSEPLIGMSVLIKGTTTGTTTDENGVYSIQANKGDVLIFSYIGYETKEITVGNETVINVVLNSGTSLNEVVVVGYGVQKKSDLTGAVSSLKGADIQQLAVPNVGEALQGRMSGVMVNQTSRVGDKPSILIRGLNTINNNAPLVIIDGIAGDLSTVDENDIESIEVLKDASSAAIYGSRGANGVIIVTTKRGKSGISRIDFNTYYGIQTLTNRIPMLDRDQHKSIYTLAYQNDGATPPASLNDPNFQNNNNWQDLLYQNGSMSKYNLQVSNGGPKSSYAVSMNYLDQGSVIPEDFLKRFSGRINSDYTLGKFKIEQSLQVGRQWINHSRVDQQTVLRTLPGLALHAPDNGLNFGYGISNTEAVNPVGLNQLERDNTSNDFAIGNLAGSYEIIKGLTYKLRVGARIDNEHFNYRRPLYELQAGRPSIPYLEEIRTNTTYTNVENTLNYYTSIGKHDFGALAGYTIEHWLTRSMKAFGQGLASNDLTTLHGVTSNVGVDGFEYPQGIVSFLARANYGYDGKYLIQASIRRDDTGKFARGKSIGVFPAVSLGWVASKDLFPNSRTLSHLKLKASYGQLGNQFIDDFQYVAFVNSSFYYPIGGGLVNGANITNLANPNLRWETTANTNFGFESEFYNGKIYFEGDYFNNKTKDILVNVPLPPSVGAAGPSQNAADVQTSGIEFLLGYRGKVKNKLKYDISANLSRNDNKVTSIGQGDPIATSPVTRIAPGHTINEIFVFEADGLFQTQAELDANAAFQPNAKLGDVKFVDRNGDKVLNDDDRMYVGRSLPDFFYGINIQLNYNKFDMGIQANGQQGGKVFNELRRRWFESPRSDLWNQTTALLDSWTPQNTDTDIARLTIANANINNRYSTLYVEDASFFRLRNVQVGYTLDNVIPQIAKMRIYFSTQNLLTISKFAYFDPDRGGNTGNQTGGGNALLNQINLIPKTFFFGLQVGF